jgi:nucleotide-binding universal stress UspA family protein
MSVIEGKTILVGIDGSPNAAAALAWAIGEARVRHASVECLYVWHESTFAYGAPGYFPLGQDDVDRVARDNLHGALTSISGPTDDVKIDLRAPIGVPVELLSQATEADDVEMAVLGARGEGGVAGLLLGSVSHAMTHRSHKPVAIIPAGWKERDPDRSVARIVVGVDGSEESERALAWAIADASAWGASVEALMVWTIPSPVLPAHLSVHAIDHVLQEGTMLALLQESVDKVNAAGVEIVCSVAQGHPAEILLERASTADLLVVGSRGRGRAREALFGSVSHASTHGAIVPVVVVKA